MNGHAETERRPVWYRVWEWLHGPVAVTSHARWAEADARLEALEEAVARVDAELGAFIDEPVDGAAD